VKTRAAGITPRNLYMRRRDFLASAGAAFGALTVKGLAMELPNGGKLSVTKKTVTTTDPPTPYDVVTSYNNFYEFGSNKSDPASNGKDFKPRPWSVAVEGLCHKPGTYTLEDVLKPHALEERVYRHRCVEGWSIVVPWIGFPLGDLLKRFEPTGAAAFVEFITVKRPAEMPGQRGILSSLLPWPYNEGLRIDEAMHPLALVAVGLYGEELPNQNGAPLRLVVPWKYGFKSIKSIVKIRLVSGQPPCTWNEVGANEYGFYSNVNPNRDHPRWSQKMERRLGEFGKRTTLMFNGYPEVASLYTGMDLIRNY
jgi:sulfoxide reductase catalytic subunit YedY